MGNFDIGALIIFFSVLLVSAVIHEMAHAASALYFGDTTARDEGRITLNPIAHIDPMMSIIVPLILFLTAGFMFGGAKPVPVDPTRFRPGVRIKRAMMWVALAGPASNFILAFFSYYLMYQGISSIDQFRYSITYDVLNAAAFVNILLGTFNLLPIPPLDGSKILAGLVPDRITLIIYKLERYAILFFILIILTPVGRYILTPMHWVADKLSSLAQILVI